MLGIVWQQYQGKREQEEPSLSFRKAVDHKAFRVPTCSPLESLHAPYPLEVKSRNDEPPMTSPGSRLLPTAELKQ